MSLSLFSGCDRPAAKPNADVTGGALPPIRVVAIKPQRKTLVRTIELPGRAEAFEVAPLHAKVTGYVQKINVDIGDSIQGPHDDQPGSALCELLVPELREELAEKVALVAQTNAQVVQSDAGVKLAEAAVRSAEARVLEAQAAVAKEEATYTRWQSEYQRVSLLADSGAVTKKLAEETRAQLEAADAGRKEVAARIASVEAMQQESVAGLEKAQADAAATRSQLAVVEAEQRRVEAMLDYSIIRAPFDGVVVERNVHTGHLVQAGGGNGQPALLSVMRIDPIRIFVDVPETDAAYVKKGNKVEVRIPSVPGEPFVGTVTRTGWSLHDTSHTLTAEIDIPNSDGRWRPGQYVLVNVTVAELPDVLSLPKTAIVTQDKQTYCYSIEANGKVMRRAVSLGVLAGTEYEVREGLTGDENIIGVNANAFREGQVVELAPPPKN